MLKKARLVALLTHHNVTLIEDDVYSELYFGREKPLPAKAWDRDDTVLHCSSFPNVWFPVFALAGLREEAMPDKFSVCS